MGLLQQRLGPRQVAEILRDEPQVVQLDRPALDAADPPQGGERFLVHRLGLGEAPLLVERHAEMGEDESDGGLVTRLGEEVAGFGEEGDRLLGAADQNQAIPLEHQGLRDDLGLS